MFVVLKSFNGGSARGFSNDAQEEEEEEEEEEEVAVEEEVVIVRDSVRCFDACFRLSSSSDEDEHVDEVDVGFVIRSWEMRGILVSGMFRASLVGAVACWEDVLALGRIGLSC